MDSDSTPPPPRELTRLLQQRAADGKLRSEELLPLVYEELRALARSRMAKESPGQTLEATALVHEVWLRVAGSGDLGWNSRGHFFGAAARAMRRILVEQARRKARIRHGGGRRRQDVDELDLGVADPGPGVLAVEDAVRELERIDSRKGRIVDLRYFAGLSAEETAETLGVSLSTVEKEWRFIKAWLKDALRDDPA